MTDPELQRIFTSPQFTSLVRLRRRLVWTLTGLVLLVFFAFLFASLYAADLMHRPFAGSDLPLGLLLGASVVLISIACGLAYLIIANRYLEPTAVHLDREISS